MTSSINKRSSNIELLRILSMFLVLVLHSLDLGIGPPTQTQCISNPWNAAIRLFIESLSVVAVNVFVLISGWFGIKPTLKKLLSLLFQVFFYTVIILIIFGAFEGFRNLSLNSVLKTFMITKCYWFIKSYLCLFIFSPVLNLFAENAKKHTFSFVLICFFAFQTIYGWTDSAPEFNYGCSVVSFAGLYLLARYMKIYPIRILCNRKLCVFVYILLSVLLTFVVWGLIKYEFHTEHSIAVAFSYINPCVIISSIALFFTFVNTEVPYSGAINWIAISSFSVYIIHTNAFLIDYFKDSVWFLHSNLSSFMRGPVVLLFLIIVYMACILLDKVRILAWEILEKVFGKEI